MPQAIWTQSYDVNTIVLNAHRQLGLVGLLNILQDAAWQHACHLGHGYDDMLDRRVIWVLIRQKLEMTYWPVWGERLEVRTWVRPITGPLALRDYQMMVGDRLCGQATACWLTMDIASRRPTRLALSPDELACRESGVLTLEPARIAVRDDCPAIATFRVRNSDLDLNGHVNNTRYAQWMQDAMPLALVEALRLHVYDVNFLAETRLGDDVGIEMAPLSGTAGTGRQAWHVQGRRQENGKAVFTARLEALPPPA